MESRSSESRSSEVRGFTSSGSKERNTYASNTANYNSDIDEIIEKYEAAFFEGEMDKVPTFDVIKDLRKLRGDA